MQNFRAHSDDHGRILNPGIPTSVDQGWIGRKFCCGRFTIAVSIVRKYVNEDDQYGFKETSRNSGTLHNSSNQLTPGEIQRLEKWYTIILLQRSIGHFGGCITSG